MENGASVQLLIVSCVRARVCVCVCFFLYVYVYVYYTALPYYLHMYVSYTVLRCYLHIRIQYMTRKRVLLCIRDEAWAIISKDRSY